MKKNVEEMKKTWSLMFFYGCEEKGEHPLCLDQVLRGLLTPLRVAGLRRPDLEELSCQVHQ